MAFDLSFFIGQAAVAMLTKRDDGSDASPVGPVQCDSGNGYNGSLGLRISSIFVILVAGCFGSLFPIISSRSSASIKMPPTLFFIAKYFGSGVIVATSLIHLLQPANEALTDPCLGEAWQVYPYAFGIALFSLFSTFLVEILSRRYLSKRGITHSHGPSGLGGGEIDLTASSVGHIHTHSDNRNNTAIEELPNNLKDDGSKDYANSESSFSSRDTLAMQLGSIFVLEFGILFHSVFVGLALAVSENIQTLYIVLVFHQMFEGFGLGTRIAVAPWPTGKKWMPWALGIAFGLTTPIAIAIGLGVRTTYPPGSHRALITNGIFDSISAGILLYSGLVELMGNEFLHSEEFESASTKRVLAAYFIMCCGAGFMALLGRWA